jgi:hypothetical protein
MQRDRPERVTLHRDEVRWQTPPGVLSGSCTPNEPLEPGSIPVSSRQRDLCTAFRACNIPNVGV